MAAGTAKGFAVFAGVAPEIIRASAHEAETRGFGSFWVNHPGPVDGLGSLAQAAAETQRIDPSQYLWGMRINFYVAAALAALGLAWFAATQRRRRRAVVAPASP